jgi:hypothetical protein
MPSDTKKEPRKAEGLKKLRAKGFLRSQEHSDDRDAVSESLLEVCEDGRRRKGEEHGRAVFLSGYNRLKIRS